MAQSEDIILETLQEINVQYNFNYEEFKTEQKDTILSVVRKQDVIAVLPTGFGKTFCFTAPSLILDKVRFSVNFS